MSKLVRRFLVASALSFTVVVPSLTTSATASAEPGADDVARRLKAEAKKLFHDANVLEKQADREREAAARAYLEALQKADATDDAAEAKRLEARKKLAKAGKFADREKKADALRAKARSILIGATRLDQRADTFLHNAKRELARAKAQREAAAALLEGNPDAEMKAAAQELIKDAEGDEADAKKLTEDATALKKKADEHRKTAGDLIKRANTLDPDGE